MKNRNKFKKLSAGFLAILISITININPIATICGAIVDSGIVDKFGNIKDHLIYMAMESPRNVKADEVDEGEETPGSNVTIEFSCDASSAINTLMGSGNVTMTNINNTLGGVQSSLNNLNTAVSNVDSSIKDVNTSVNNVNASIGNLNTNVINGFTTISGYIDELEADNDIIIEDLEAIINQLGYDKVKGGHGSVAADLASIDQKLTQINNTIKDQQHKYRVAHLYSLNNKFQNSLYRPTTNDIPYVKDFATVAGSFANVYTGYWDTAVSSVADSSKWWRKVVKHADSNEYVYQYDRYAEVLGDDIIIRAEGIVPQKNVFFGATDTLKGLSGMNSFAGDVSNISVITDLVQQTMPEEEITWLDAVTVLYKALGQEQYTYQTFMSKNPSITPETSPAFQNLSNPIPNEDGTYNGHDFYFFVTRSNVITSAYAGDTEAKQNNVYWTKALRDGFVSGGEDLMYENILMSDFYILAQDMMIAYGEPHINDDEIKALLQVYGSEYPVQLGYQVADAWAYLKVRGCLDVTAYPSDAVTRDNLLDIATRVKDKTFRSDYKVINVVLDLSDLFRDNGYYPVYDLSVTTDKFQSTVTYNYKEMTYYDYLIPIVADKSLGTVGELRAYSEPKRSDSKLIKGFKYAANVTVGGHEFYDIQIPKDYSGNIYLAKTDYDNGATVNGEVDFICIPSDVLGGGIFVTLKDIDKDKISFVGKEEQDIIPFSTYNNTDAIVPMSDYLRAGEAERPKAETISANATTLETILFSLEKWTSPMTANAADAFNITTNGAITNVKISYMHSAIGVGLTPGSGTVNLGTLNGNKEESLLKDELGLDVAIDNVYRATREPLASLSRIALLEHMSIKDYVKYTPRGLSSFFDYTDTNYGMDSNTSERYAIDAMEKSSTGNVRKFLMTDNFKQYYWQGYGETSPSIKALDRGLLVAYVEGLIPTKIYSNVFRFPDTGPINSKPTYKYSLINPDYYMNGVNDNRDSWKEYLGRYETEDNLNTLRSWLTDVYISNVNFGGVGESSWISFNTTKPDETIAKFGIEANKTTSSSGMDTNDVTLKMNADLTSSAIMRKDQQILLSWSDLVDAEYIIPDVTKDQPKQQSDGSYYFFTKQGQVKVNDIQHTIQIGTTLYDLSRSDGNSPRLIYIDTEQNNEMYLDYRCVLGIVRQAVTYEEGTAEYTVCSLGSGTQVVYDLGSRGVESDGFSQSEHKAYNFPEIKEKDFGGNLMANIDGYEVNLIKHTMYDTIEVDGKGSYWDTNSISRLNMASFVPTANWIVVVDDGGDEPVGKIFIYYPKEPFEVGFAETSTTVSESDGTITISGLQQVEEQQAERLYAYSDWEDKVKNASAMYSKKNADLTNVIKSAYGQDFSTYKWWQEMSANAIAELYSMTGTYYVSPDYVVRSVDISHCNIASSTLYAVNDGKPYTDKLLSNEAGVMYWVDNIGYVYNMPTIEDFTLKKYFQGEYLIPLAIDTTSVIDGTQKIVNYNMPSYGNYYYENTHDTWTVSNSKIPYGYALSSKEGVIHYKSFNSIITDISLPHKGDKNTSTLVPPIDISTFTPAPSGIYSFFGRNLAERTTIGGMTDYVSMANSIYYGTNQMIVSNSQNETSDKDITLFGNNYNPVQMNTATIGYRVLHTTKKDTIIVVPTNLAMANSEGIGSVDIDDFSPNAIEDFLSKIGTNSLIDAIDNGASWLILIAFNVLPIIGIVLMTILIGLSFTSDVKIVRLICEKTFDPIRLLTLGGRDINTWKWKKVLFPCTMLYLAFALFLNGNLIRIVMWSAKWIGVLEKWIKTL